MADYEMLASGCDPYPQCQKVARHTTGMVAIVGSVITDPPDTGRTRRWARRGRGRDH